VLGMGVVKESIGVQEYTTAAFRKDMAEVFAAARFQDAIVDVSHHGKPWVSIMSPRNAEALKKIRDLGKVEVAEVAAALHLLDSPISFDELALLISDARARGNSSFE